MLGVEWLARLVLCIALAGSPGAAGVGRLAGGRLPAPVRGKPPSLTARTHPARVLGVLDLRLFGHLSVAGAWLLSVSDASQRIL